MASQWPPREVVNLRDHLDILASAVEGTQKGDVSDAIVGWLARFLVVRSCGYLEQVVVEACRVYVRKRSGGLVQMFAYSWLERTGNPSPESLTRLVRRFDGTLGDELDSFLDADDQSLRRQVHFLVDRRNQIAHGLNEGVGIRKALDLKGTACDVADWFILKFNPQREVPSL